jgi:hypothetical protein
MEVVKVLDEHSRWKSRDVSYIGGTWQQIRKRIPEFELVDFNAGEGLPHNPFLKTVMRTPLAATENPMPVGVVSNSYTLAQHREVGDICIEGIKDADVDPENLQCEVGLSDLGEWMNLRIYFPEEFNLTPSDGNTLGLRLECFNSVDGSSRLVILLGWIRFICSNGMVIGETKAEIRDIHNANMDLSPIPEIIKVGLEKVKNDRRRIHYWEKRLIPESKWVGWINGNLSKKWGKKAACRTFHICDHGHDVEFSDPFATGEATEKPVRNVERVAGAPEKATNLYDVAQALSWIATNRTNADRRLEWQSQIPNLLDDLAGQKFKLRANSQTDMFGGA